MTTATNDPAAWTRSSFADENAYLVHLTAEDRQTIVDAVHKLRERGRLDVPVETLTKDEFAFGSLSAKLDALPCGASACTSAGGCSRRTHRAN